MRVLVICYQIERGKGSEAGSGYNFVVNLNRLAHDITLVTRPNNAERLTGDALMEGVRIVGHDPARAITRLKRGSRGLVLFYYIWQAGVGRLAAELHEREPFDVVHQYNFHTDWAPHFLRVPGARVVWGPICHQPTLPWSFLQLERWRGPVREAGKALLKRFFWNVDPNVRRAIRASNVILFANEDVPRVFARSGKVRQQTFGGALPGQAARARATSGPLELLHVGRCVSIKGAAVALDAVREARARGADVRLTLVGEGLLRHELEAKARSSGLGAVVRFLPWLSQEQLARVYARADAFLYPSLGNQDGVVAEALAASLPVIGIGGSGTAVMAADAGAWARPGPYARLVGDLAAAIVTMAKEARAGTEGWQARRDTALRRAEMLSWSTTAQQISARYRPT